MGQPQIMNAKQRCVKCQGKGFVHESNMDHKTGDANQKCFFCEDCKGCGGKGFHQGAQNANAFGGGVATCLKCRGNGWLHASSMEHKTGDPNQKCFFCEDCKSCAGKGRI